jgi:hypothetical protein
VGGKASIGHLILHLDSLKQKKIKLTVFWKRSSNCWMIFFLDVRGKASDGHPMLDLFLRLQ